MNLSHTKKNSSLQENPEEIMRNQLNKSSSKMQYSFGQSRRFGDRSLSVSPSKYYDLPSLWSQKGASIGRSSRHDFSKSNVLTPAPNNYKLTSSFIKKKSQGITMGLGRDQVKYRDMFQLSYKKCPDFGSYQPQKSYNTRLYSIAHRLNNDDNKWARQVPGPGNYKFIQLTNNKNKKNISKYLSAHSMQFGKQKRQSLATKNLVPGPGHYNSRSQSFDQSLFDKAYVSRFGSGERRGLSDTKFVTPGPGTYKSFSQFLR